MPAFAAIVTALKESQPLRGARIACTLPDAPGATAVVGALRTLGASVQWAPRGGHPKQVARLLDWPDGAGPNLLLEHGASMSRLIHAGTRAQGRNQNIDGRSYSAIATLIQGTTEASRLGAVWLARQSSSSELLYPAMDCSAIGPFADIGPEDRSLRGSSALSLLVLSQVELFGSMAQASPALRQPSAPMTRLVANAHGHLLRSRIAKLRDISSNDSG
jgi:hypothetical protein